MIPDFPQRIAAASLKRRSWATTGAEKLHFPQRIAAASLKQMIQPAFTIKNTTFSAAMTHKMSLLLC